MRTLAFVTQVAFFSLVTNSIDAAEVLKVIPASKRVILKLKPEESKTLKLKDEVTLTQGEESFFGTVKEVSQNKAMIAIDFEIKKLKPRSQVTIQPAALAQNIAPSTEITANASTSDEQLSASSSTNPHFLANPSPFMEVIDQTEHFRLSESHHGPFGAHILRAQRIRVGGSYLMDSVNFKDSHSSGTTKTDITSQDLAVFGLIPLPMGPKLGAMYFQQDASAKVKANYAGRDASFKVKGNSSGFVFTAAAVHKSGFGGALKLSQISEKTKVDGAAEESVTYGAIDPEFYGRFGDWELIAGWTPSRRHETSTKNGHYFFIAEGRLAPTFSLFTEVIRSRNSENDGDTERDHFDLAVGPRLFLDNDTNIKLLVHGREAFHAGPENASVGSIARLGLSAVGSHIIQDQHSVGYNLMYFTGNGKASQPPSSEKAKLSSTELTVGGSYAYRF